MKRTFYKRFGLKPQSLQKVRVSCIDCGKEWDKVSYTKNRGNGRCRSCAQKVEKNKPDVREKMSVLAREQVLRQGGIPNAKHFKSDEVKGPANRNWKGGITPANQVGRMSPAGISWRKSVFVRDGFSCQICKKVGGSLNAHHIKPWSGYPELRHQIENGITLCELCHKTLHSKGKGEKNQ